MNFVPTYLLVIAFLLIVHLAMQYVIEIDPAYVLCTEQREPQFIDA
jgi:hypothetical protein